MAQLEVWARGQTLLKGAHWTPFGNATISSLKFTYITYVWGLVFACLRHIYVGISLHAHLVRGESHIELHANQEVATKGTQITQNGYLQRSTKQMLHYTVKNE